MKQLLLRTSALLCIFGYSAVGTIAQSQKKINNNNEVSGPICGTKSPGIEWEQAFETQVAAYKKELARNGRAVPYTIPVVVHVLYSGTSEAAIGTAANLFAGQIQAQIDVLNQAFAGNSPGNSTLPTVFSNVDANDVGISFCLATKDKNGNTLAEPGIDRINWQSKGWTNPTSFTSASGVINYFDKTIKPVSIWDPTKYFNIWVANFSNNSGLYGYAKFPASSTLVLNVSSSDLGTSKNDGIVVASLCFGSKTIFPAGFYNTANDIRSYGTTSVHEVGHWLGLRHIWGDSYCGTDYCNDTPVQATNLYALCPTHPYNVGNCSGNTTGEMFQNFMGYATDACVSLFTAGQETRMLTAMLNSPNRKLLGTHGLCGSAPVVASALMGMGETDDAVSGIRIYPNPSTGEVTLDTREYKEELSEVSIVNAFGQSVRKYNMLNGNNNVLQLSLNHLSKGIYTVIIKTPNGNVAKKLVIE
jgi:hypothetical protein